MNHLGVEDAPVASRATSSVVSRFIDPPEKKWQVVWSWISERANPIVVKEARQALNSRQFSISFSLTLMAVVFWTIMATLTQLPDMYYVPGGRYMLSGFLIILAFPLILVIPFSAFRSMAIESEERTFELVSISALSAGQIVQGKMASACLQIAIYVSALAPCIVVTYLLRGVSLAVILNYLIYTIMMSVVLSGASILFATISRARLIQVFASICVLAGLLITFIYVSAAIAFSLIGVGTVPIEQFGWLVALAMSTIVLALTMVFMRCAATAIDFPSENHAFALRLRIALAAAVIFFWSLWLAIEAQSYEVCLVFVIATLIVSLGIGGLISGERGILSPRAQRTLPKTVLGRMFLTWFYPGAGLGYIFLSCLVTSLMIGWVALGLLGSSFQLSIEYGETVAAVGIVCWSYVILYTGLSRLLMLSVSRKVAARVMVGLLLQLFLVGLGTFLPFFTMLTLTRFQQFEYGWHQALHPVWTIGNLISYGITAANTPTLIILPLLALAIFGLNLLLSGRDVMLIRIALPPRLEEELKAQAPVRAAVPDPFS